MGTHAHINKARRKHTEADCSLESFECKSVLKHVTHGDRKVRLFPVLLCLNSSNVSTNTLEGTSFPRNTWRYPRFRQINLDG